MSCCAWWLEMSFELAVEISTAILPSMVQCTIKKINVQAEEYFGSNRI